MSSHPGLFIQIRKICFSPRNGYVSESKIKYSPILKSNLAPLNQGRYRQLPRDNLDPRVEMCPSVGWKSLLMGLFWLKLCSNGSKKEGLNQTLGCRAELALPFLYNVK